MTATATATREYVRGLREELARRLDLPVYAYAPRTDDPSVRVETGHATITGGDLVGGGFEQATYHVQLLVRVIVEAGGVQGASEGDADGTEPLADEMAALSVAVALALRAPLTVPARGMPGTAAVLHPATPDGQAAYVPTGDDGTSAFRIGYAATLAFEVAAPVSAADDSPSDLPPGFL